MGGSGSSDGGMTQQRPLQHRRGFLLPPAWLLPPQPKASFSCSTEGGGSGRTAKWHGYPLAATFGLTQCDWQLRQQKDSQEDRAAGRERADQVPQGNPLPIRWPKGTGGEGKLRKTPGDPNRRRQSRAKEDLPGREETPQDQPPAAPYQGHLSSNPPSHHVQYEEGKRLWTVPQTKEVQPINPNFMRSLN